MLSPDVASIYHPLRVSKSEYDSIIKGMIRRNLFWMAYCELNADDYHDSPLKISIYDVMDENIYNITELSGLFIAQSDDELRSGGRYPSLNIDTGLAEVVYQPDNETDRIDITICLKRDMDTWILWAKNKKNGIITYDIHDFEQYLIQQEIASVKALKEDYAWAGNRECKYNDPRILLHFDHFMHSIQNPSEQIMAMMDLVSLTNLDDAME